MTALDFQLRATFGQALKQIESIQRQIPFVQSMAARDAVIAGRKEAIRQALASFKDPIPALFNERKGWIFVEWDDKQEAKRKGVASGKIQIRGLGRNPKELAAQQEIAHRNIYGTVERNTPISVPYIIKPSKYLRFGARIRNVPLRIDKHGNIKGTRNRSYVDTVTDMVTNPKYKGQFFEVKLGERAYAGGRVLSPGLYQRLQFRKRNSDYARHPRTGTRRGPYKTKRDPQGKNKLTSRYILTLLQFYPVRDYKRTWNFKPPAIAVMRATYSVSFVTYLDKVIDEQRKRGPRGQRGTGTLL